MRNKCSAPFLVRALAGTTLAAASILASAQTPAKPHVFFRVKLADSAPGPVSGRLLIFLKKGTGDKEVNIQEFHPGETSVALPRRGHIHLMPGTSVELNANLIAYPDAFSTLPAADYEVQAVLDTDHTYNYSGRTPSDWVTPVLTLAKWTPGSSEPTLTLDSHPAENPMRAPALARAHQQSKARRDRRAGDAQSPAHPLLRKPNLHQSLGRLAPGLWKRTQPEALSHRLFHSWFWRQPGLQRRSSGHDPRPAWTPAPCPR